MSFTKVAYKVARASATGRAVRTGKVAKRAKNVAVGRALGRAGIWRRMWR